MSRNKILPRELADDLLAVCNYFVAKNNGMCSAENRRKRKQQAKEEAKDKQNQRKGTSRKSQKNTFVSESESEGDPEEVVWDSEMDL
jgi:tellurite resistance protein